MIPTWVERCKKFEDSEIITYEKIQEVMQEEIDELRTELALQKLSDISQEIENEPVAWMIKTLDGKKIMLYGDENPPLFEKDIQKIPLYTHPMRELTDVEILEEFHDLHDKFEQGFSCLQFARAILKKASEK